MSFCVPSPIWSRAYRYNVTLLIYKWYFYWTCAFWLNNNWPTWIHTTINRKRLIFDHFNGFFFFFLKGYFELIPSESRDTHKKAIGYLSYFAFGLYSETFKLAKTITDKSFESLPENLQRKVLDAAGEVSDYLKQIKASSCYSRKKMFEKIIVWLVIFIIYSYF